MKCQLTKVNLNMVPKLSLFIQKKSKCLIVGNLPGYLSSGKTQKIDIWSKLDIYILACRFNFYIY